MTALEPTTPLDLATIAPRPSSIRPPVGLLLSIGDQAPNASGNGTHPVKLDHFRAKPGKLGQYAREMQAFTAHYGDQPKLIEDVYFLADTVPGVLDIRLLAFSQTGFRGRGDTNLAALDPASFEQKIRDPFTGEQFEFFPKDASEVRVELRDAWEGEPIVGTLDGPNDPRVQRLGIKLVCSLEFMLPEIMGVGRVARITTSGRRSTRNLFSAIWDQYSFFGGRLRGIPFRLEVRPARTQRFDTTKRAYVGVDFFEIVIDTPFTYAEVRRAIEEHRQTLGEPSREQLALEGKIAQKALALPSPSGEETTRDEPVAGPSDALLNRLARLEEEVGRAESLTVLRGVFGVEDPRDLSAEDAERYWQTLERAAPAEEVEGEIVSEVGAGVPGLGDGATETAPTDPPTPTGSTGEPAVSPAAAVEDAEEAHVTEVAPAGVEPPASLLDFEQEADPGDAVVPLGRYKGKTIAQAVALEPGWVEKALRHPASFGPHSAFLATLRAYSESRS